MDINHIYHGSAFDVISGFESETIDCMVTDPPYGYSFMNKDWDRAIVPVETWRECLRVLKPGSFACIMSSPRQDVLSRMIVNLQDAGFRTDFTSLYWTYASGFPKASNVSKLVDKRNGHSIDYIEIAKYIKQKRIESDLSQDYVNSELDNAKLKVQHYESMNMEFNRIPTLKDYLVLKKLLDLDNRFDELIEREEAEREIIGQSKQKGNIGYESESYEYKPNIRYITKSVTEQAKTLDGSYGGFQPKPAVEVVLMVMKPLKEKTFVDQALKNGKGCTWLDSGRIPFTRPPEEEPGYRQNYKNYNLNTFKYEKWSNDKKTRPLQKDQYDNKGRFPANLLVSDDVLNDGKVWRGATDSHKASSIYGNQMKDKQKGWGKENFGSYSRYFDLDAWFSTTFPFIITPKPSPKEKNMGLDRWIMPEKDIGHNRFDKCAKCGKYILQNPTRPSKCNCDIPERQNNIIKGNFHPTVKSIKLMCYLISLVSSRPPNDLVMDPFMGSGTTAMAAQLLKRRWVGMETNKEYIEIANQRISHMLSFR